MTSFARSPSKAVALLIGFLISPAASRRAEVNQFSLLQAEGGVKDFDPPAAESHAWCGRRVEGSVLRASRHEGTRDGDICKCSRGSWITGAAAHCHPAERTRKFDPSAFEGCHCRSAEGEGDVAAIARQPPVVVTALSGHPVDVLDHLPRVDRHTASQEADRGSHVFSDRLYSFTSLGDFANKTFYYIRVPNDDKTTLANAPMLNFRTTVPVRVYLDFWGGEVHIRAGANLWLETPDSEWVPAVFSNTRHQFTMAGVYGRVYERRFEAGEFSIYGNGGRMGHGNFLTFVDPELVTVSASSGHPIEVVSHVPAAREFVFTDRNYQFDSVGDFAGRNLYWLKVPNEDKDTPASQVMWNLQVHVPMMVYLDFWGGEQHVNAGANAWLTAPGSEWERTSMTGTSFAGFQGGIVYSRRFEEGAIEIMGNGGRNNHGNFYVFLEPRKATETVDRSSCEPPRDHRFSADRIVDRDTMTCEEEDYAGTRSCMCASAYDCYVSKALRPEPKNVKRCFRARDED